jgi:hypothetical protein
MGKKERNITYLVMRDIEIGAVEMSNCRDNTSCISCSLWLNDGETWGNRGI